MDLASPGFWIRCLEILSRFHSKRRDNRIDELLLPDGIAEEDHASEVCQQHMWVFLLFHLHFLEVSESFSLTKVIQLG